MGAGSGEGRGGEVVNKAVVAGLLGLQLLSLPLGVVSRQPRGAALPPRLEVLSAAAEATAPQPTEEEKFGEFGVHQYSSTAHCGHRSPSIYNKSGPKIRYSGRENYETS